MNAPKVEQIKAATAEAFGIPLPALVGRRRTATVAIARQVAMYLARRTGMTLCQVGAAFGRDHGTVIHACHRVRHWLDTGDEHAPKILDLVGRFCADGAATTTTNG